MTKKAMKLLFVPLLKSVLWFLGIYALVIAILATIFYLMLDPDMEWMSISTQFAPRIYLLVLGIVYPLVHLELYVSKGLTRRQFFHALLGAISILSLVLLLPTLIAEAFLGTLTPLSVIYDFVQLPLFFLAGWCAGIGFRFNTWLAALLGILGAVASLQIMNIIVETFALPLFAQLLIGVLILGLQLLLLPKVLHRAPLKS